ncbi:hypothetical protein [Shimazuella kribbensis]|uniref:hypothetical protein n=1 Tax=Shimazuella kribbensis TaxID=139808 RepID=UPI0003FD85D0|nr:hypothetical protein [Shimazuella kribbensis]
MSQTIEYSEIAMLLVQGSTPLRDAASTLNAYRKGPKGLAPHLIQWRVDSRPLNDGDQELLDKALQMINS